MLTQLFSRLKQGLSRTRTQLTQGLANVFLGKKTIDAELFEQIETQLLLADVGVSATQRIMEQLTATANRKQLKDPQALWLVLRDIMTNLLKPACQPWQPAQDVKPLVILMVGINGAGKTTTIGKLTQYLQNQSKQVMLAAGDTFRAAAVQQLQVWGQRHDVPVVAQATGSDSASVIYDALQAARARGMDVLIADTAGRLHTKHNLMDELSKVKRVLQKLDLSAPHETWLVIDATTGQNALQQAEQFHKSMGLTGVVVTKLDGTAKGGMIFNVVERLALPIRFIGVGEQSEDLRPFNAEEFTEALFQVE